MDISEARKKLDLTQEELAARLGCSRAIVAMWETGRCLPRPARAKRLAELLQISLEEVYASAQDRAA